MDALNIALAFVLVLANGFFVATEFAVTRARPAQVDAWVRDRRPGARSAKHAVEHIDAYLAACQLGITISSLGLGALGEPAFHHILEPVFGEAAQLAGIGVASAIAFGIITLLHVVVGELAPKSLALSRTEKVVLLVAPIMRGFYLVTRPVVDLFNGLGNLLLKPFGIPPAREAGHAPASEDELRTLLRESAAGGEIEDEEQRFGENVLTFGDRRVREVMIPRHRAVFVTHGPDVRRRRRGRAPHRPHARAAVPPRGRARRGGRAPARQGPADRRRRRPRGARPPARARPRVDADRRAARAAPPPARALRRSWSTSTGRRSA